MLKLLSASPKPLVRRAGGGRDATCQRVDARNALSTDPQKRKWKPPDLINVARSKTVSTIGLSMHCFAVTSTKCSRWFWHKILCIAGAPGRFSEYAYKRSSEYAPSIAHVTVTLQSSFWNSRIKATRRSSGGVNSNPSNKPLASLEFSFVGVHKIGTSSF